MPPKITDQQIVKAVMSELNACILDPTELEEVSLDLSATQSTQELMGELLKSVTPYIDFIKANFDSNSKEERQKKIYQQLDWITAQPIIKDAIYTARSLYLRKIIESNAELKKNKSAQKSMLQANTIENILDSSKVYPFIEILNPVAMCSDLCIRTQNIIKAFSYNKTLPKKDVQNLLYAIEIISLKLIITKNSLPKLIENALEIYADSKLKQNFKINDITLKDDGKIQIKIAPSAQTAILDMLTTTGIGPDFTGLDAIHKNLLELRKQLLIEYAEYGLADFANFTSRYNVLRYTPEQLEKYIPPLSETIYDNHQQEDINNLLAATTGVTAEKIILDVNKKELAYVQHYLLSIKNIALGTSKDRFYLEKTKAQKNSLSALGKPELKKLNDEIDSYLHSVLVTLEGEEKISIQDIYNNCTLAENFIYKTVSKYADQYTSKRKEKTLGASSSSTATTITIQYDKPRSSTSSNEKLTDWELTKQSEARVQYLKEQAERQARLAREMEEANNSIQVKSNTEKKPYGKIMTAEEFLSLADQDIDVYNFIKNTVFNLDQAHVKINSVNAYLPKLGLKVERRAKGHFFYTLPNGESTISSGYHPNPSKHESNPVINAETLRYIRESLDNIGINKQNWEELTAQYCPRQNPQAPKNQAPTP